MIKILHLYYDLLNLYGENANVRAIVHELKRNNIKTKVDLKSINDIIDFNKYDIIYIGSGDEENVLLAFEDLKKRAISIKEFIETKGYLLLTGNAMYLFATRIVTTEEYVEGEYTLNYDINYLTKNTFKNASNLRIVGETISTTSLIKEKIIGFQNRCGRLFNVRYPFLETDKKFSNEGTNNYEGFNYKNVYATQNIGPLFIRNPYFLDYILNKLCKEKKLKYVVEKNSTAKKAYNKYLDI